jgi:hypothetical protein
MKLPLSAVILTAVIGLVSCDSATNSLNKNTLTKSDLADAIKGSCKPGSVSSTSDCKSEISNSKIATKSLVCDASGTKSAAGPCLVSSCAQDYSLVDNACVVPQCQKGKVYAAEDCRAEIPFSVSASKAKACDRDGKQFVYEPCQVTGCSPGYKIIGNKCIAQACTPNQTDLVDCRQEIPFSAGAIKTRFCDAAGTAFSYDICRVTACQSGYTTSGNSCIPGTCAPGQSYGDANCTEEIPFASRASKTMNCHSSGNYFTYGPCVVSYCQYGSQRVENTCVNQFCNAKASYGTVDCTSEIPFSASATKEKVCRDSGFGFTYGSCRNSGCKSGYLLESNSCIALECEPNQVIGYGDCKRDIPNSLIATQTLSCDSRGVSHIGGRCEVKQCQSGYILNSNSCELAMCEANRELSPASCRDEIPFSVSAVRTKKCNETGKGIIDGPCMVTGCEAGYLVSNNSCIPQTCAPYANAGLVECTRDIPFSLVAIKVKNCNDTGDGYTYEPCKATRCESEYVVTGNSCVPKTCESGRRLPPVQCQLDDAPIGTVSYKLKTCNANGDGFVYGKCETVGCADGYGSDSFSTCLPKVCRANEDLGRVDCKDELPSSTAATKSKMCSGSGVDYLFGSCEATTCKSGYYLQDGLCVLNHRIFVSSESYTGKIGVQSDWSAGLSTAQQANRKCQNLAERAGLTNGGSWHAILGGLSEINIRGPVFDMKGTRVASGATQFWTNPGFIAYDEKSQSTSYGSVWTGLVPRYGRFDEAKLTCGRWSRDESTVYGTIGYTVPVEFFSSGRPLYASLADTGDPCSMKKPIYCIDNQ